MGELIDFHADGWQIELSGSLSVTHSAENETPMVILLIAVIVRTVGTNTAHYKSNLCIHFIPK